LTQKKQVVILPIEPLSTRYTAQWHEFFPKQLQSYLGEDFQILQIDGELTAAKPTPGAFLDFAATNIWKSTQLAKLMKKIQDGKIRPGAYILVTDAWNPAILQIRYTSDLMNLGLRIGAIWHAGSYDPNDFLGRASGGKLWAQHTERAIFHACDHNFFATHAHIDLFIDTYTIQKSEIGEPPAEIVRTGFPFEYFEQEFIPYRDLEKRELILFPHRIAPEKQLHVFKALAERMPEYDWIVCQEQELTKDEYHTLLGQSRIVFSANLQETLGISMMEALMCNSFPLMPERLSYPEMYDDKFLYPSEWADSNNANLNRLEEHIKILMFAWEKESTTLLIDIAEQREKIKKQFLTAGALHNKIRECINTSPSFKE